MKDVAYTIIKHGWWLTSPVMKYDQEKKYTQQALKLYKCFEDFMRIVAIGRSYRGHSNETTVIEELGRKYQQ